VGIAEKFHRSRNSMHDANRLTLQRVWSISDTGATAWAKLRTDLKHTRQLWHGTSAGNVLSILRTGLICPGR
jgi:poly [ADP-ribose] polymerase